MLGDVGKSLLYGLFSALVSVGVFAFGKQKDKLLGVATQSRRAQGGVASVFCLDIRKYTVSLGGKMRIAVKL
jgi:hypothetical protein